MLCNNLDPDVAERPNDLVVYGGNGRAARSWAAFDAMVRTLTRLKNDETMIVQSGKPVAVWRTHDRAPRVLLANSNLVPKWADWKTFRELEAQGLTMYGQMTAVSWIYIGTQGIVQGTYETFAELARQHFGGSLKGRVCLTAGVGGMGGAQPLAITMNGGVALLVARDSNGGAICAISTSSPIHAKRHSRKSNELAPRVRRSLSATRAMLPPSSGNSTTPVFVPMRLPTRPPRTT